MADTKETQVSIRGLLNLKVDDLVEVKLRSGRVIVGKLRKRPVLVYRGKPGINRVDLEVGDIEALEKLSDDAAMFAHLPHIHSVSGDRVISIKST